MDTSFSDLKMPFDLLTLVEKDETLATCQCFNAKVCYGSGLQYCATEASAPVKSAIEDLTLETVWKIQEFIVILHRATNCADI